jgi:hypothetical protein
LSFFIGFSWELIAWKFLLGIDSFFLGKYFGKSWKILENLSRFRRGEFFIPVLWDRRNPSENFGKKLQNSDYVIVFIFDTICGHPLLGSITAGPPSFHKE